MTITKSILLGSATAILAVASASAADLPSRKSAPVEYVKVCTAYGAGFFFIPGTDTCLKIGGRVRADYAYVGAKAQFSGLGTVAGTTAPVVSQAKDGQNTIGYEARGRIDFDARTRTSFGTVQTAAGLRMARVTGILSQAAAASATSTSTALEYAFVRFAGFTFGASRDNFAFMPSLPYGAGHWGSFANGAKQLAYTATFGGGISATIALQDYLDTAGASSIANAGFTGGVALAAAPYYVYNSIPQINANVRIDQAWGAFQLMGAYADVSAANVGTNAVAAQNYDKSKGVYAIGAGAKINLPMLAKGDALYLTAAYANGMSEYTTNWTSFKSFGLQPRRRRLHHEPPEPCGRDPLVLRLSSPGRSLHCLNITGLPSTVRFCLHHTASLTPRRAPRLAPGTARPASATPLPGTSAPTSPGSRFAASKSAWKSFTPA